jgi:hypothetical protein
VKAFDELVRNVPQATLQLAGDVSPELAENLLHSVLPGARNAIEFIPVTSDDVLASLYRNAAVSVVPSLREPFGMVTVESLASGTPVVGTNNGATPEILDNPEIGVLFEPTDDPGELSQAMLRGLELARNSLTEQRCRRHAEQYSLNAVGTRYEQLFEEVVSGSKGARMRNRAYRKEDKVNSPHQSDRDVSANTAAAVTVSDKVFEDVLDELDITYETYFAIDLHRPRCLSIFTWLIAHTVRDANMLVLAPFPRPFTMLAEKLGFRAKGISVVQKVEPWKDIENQTELSVLENSLSGLSGYDIIICDDLLQHMEYPLRTFQALKERLYPDGILALTCKNAASGMRRLQLLLGRNICPGPVHDIYDEEPSSADSQRLLPYREYTLDEVVTMLSSFGFDVAHHQYVIGKKAIDNNWVSMPVSTYLFRKLYYAVQVMVPSLRSHVFVAFTKSIPDEVSSSRSRPS